MTDRRLILLSVCIGVCLVGALAPAWGVKTEKSIPNGDFVYEPGHYLAGQTIETGFDIFGMNYQAKINNTNQMNHEICWLGLPPWEGDDAAYFQRLVDEDLAADVTEAQAMMEATGWHLWWARTRSCLFWWNEAWLSNHLDLNDDGCLDWHPGWPTFHGSGAAWEAMWWNLWSTGPDDPQPGRMRLTLVAVPLDAWKDFPGGTWHEADGTVIGYDWAGESDCFAVPRQDCYCDDELVYRYRAPSDWAKIRVKAQ